MRYMIANWKMQLDADASQALAREIVRLWAADDAAERVTVVLCPSHVALAGVAEAVKGTHVALGAQDTFWEDKGAYTGEVSPRELRTLGTDYCLVGHSERRGNLGETDAMVNRKTLALLADGITPIVCVGETLEERQAGKRDSTVIAQVRAALAGVSLVGTQRVIVAYEPRWVIGTGQAVAPEDAASMHHLIVATLHETLGEEVAARQTAVIYGGSADSRNVSGFLSVPEIRGALVGGASLKAAEFVAMAREAADAA